MARTEGSVSRPFPGHSLENALVIVQAIADKGASRSMDRLLLADAIGRTPSSSEYRRILSSSLKYGLTTGTEKSDNISPTELGLRIANPTSEQEKAEGLIQAALKPELMARIFRHYNRSKLPELTFFRNALQKTFNVEPSLTEELATLLVENAKFCGFLQDISGAKYIRVLERVTEEARTDSENVVPFRDADAASSRASSAVATAPLVPAASAAVASANAPITPRAAEAPTKPKKIFVAHGKNLKPMEGLKKILDQFQIEHVVAADEPHGGRPISIKVAQLMAECNAGIFIFTKDEKFLRPADGGGDPMEVWRPSENVVYELGAASVMWDRRIIILREDGVNFPSDFRDIGYITFTGVDVGSKALELLRELVSMGLVKVQAA